MTGHGDFDIRDSVPAEAGAACIEWAWQVEAMQDGCPLAEGRLDKALHNVPADIDREVAALKLAAMSIAIDTLTPAQAYYLFSWREGT
jgi:S-adenosylhomocysteine hydrolase